MAEIDTHRVITDLPRALKEIETGAAVTNILYGMPVVRLEPIGVKSTEEAVRCVLAVRARIAADKFSMKALIEEGRR